MGLTLKRVVSLKKQIAYYEGLIAGGKTLYDILVKKDQIKLNSLLSGMVFSKDRPLQLHALLTSYYKRVKNPVPLTVLYTTSNSEIEGFYSDLKNLFLDRQVVFIKEEDFRRQVLNWLHVTNSDRVFFMTDDAIFLDELDLNDSLLFNPIEYIFTLRYGMDLDYCYAYNMKQKLPSLRKYEEISSKFYTWRWNENFDSPDWSYPLSVDGNVYYRDEILAMCSNINFKSPNSLEMGMQVFSDYFLNRKGVCFEKVKMINIPCNRVQNEVNNRTLQYFSTQDLLDVWKQGKRIDIDAFYGQNARDAVNFIYKFI